MRGWGHVPQDALSHINPYDYQVTGVAARAFHKLFGGWILCYFLLFSTHVDHARQARERSNKDQSENLWLQGSYCLEGEIKSAC